jgi:N-acylglucosamine-6-phosphate 2-epimerase
VTFNIPKGGLVVSCQARNDNPLHGSMFMVAMARAAVQGGAAGIRANGEDDIAAIKAVVSVPVIGIRKRFSPDFPVYITPGYRDAEMIVAAGADILALDATGRARDGEPVEKLIERIKRRLQVPVMADVSSLEDAQKAIQAGADAVATTLSGYTEASAHLVSQGPDFALIEAIARISPVPVIAEGRIATPDAFRRALAAGAHAVVVGTAITNPREITRQFLA